MMQYYYEEHIPIELFALLQNLLLNDDGAVNNQQVDLIIQMVESLKIGDMSKVPQIKFLVELLTQIFKWNKHKQAIKSLQSIIITMNPIVSSLIKGTQIGTYPRFICQSFFLLQSALNQFIKQNELELKLQNHIKQSQTNVKVMQKRLNKKSKIQTSKNTNLKKQIRQMHKIQKYGRQDQFFQILQEKQLSLNKLQTMIVQLKQQKAQLEQQNVKQNTQYHDMLQSQRLVNQQKSKYLDNVKDGLQIQHNQIKLQKQQIKRQLVRLQTFRIQNDKQRISQSNIVNKIQSELESALKGIDINNIMYQQQLQKKTLQTAHQKQLLTKHAQQYAKQHQQNVQHQKNIRQLNETINKLKKIYQQTESQWKNVQTDLEKRQMVNITHITNSQIQIKTLQQINMQQLRQKQQVNKQLILLNEQLSIEKQQKQKLKTQLQSVNSILNTITGRYQKQILKSQILEKQNQELQQQKNQFRTIIDKQCEQLAENIVLMTQSTLKHQINKQSLSVLDKIAKTNSQAIIQNQTQNKVNIQKLSEQMHESRVYSENKLKLINTSLQLQLAQSKKTKIQYKQLIDRLNKLIEFVSSQNKSSKATSENIQIQINENNVTMNQTSNHMIKQLQRVKQNQNKIKTLSQTLANYKKTNQSIYDDLQNKNILRQKQITKMNSFVNSQIVKLKSSINQTSKLNDQQYKSATSSIQQLNKQLRSIIQQNQIDGLMRMDELQKQITTHIENFTNQLETVKHKGMTQINSIRQDLEQTTKRGRLQIYKLKKKVKLNESNNQKDMGLIIQNLIRIDQNQIDSQSQILKIKQELMENKRMQSALYRYKQYSSNINFLYH